MSRVRVISAACSTALASLVLGISAQAASATTYCVTTPSAPPGCSGTNEATFADALTAANGDSSGTDQIVLPAGTQTGPAGGYKYSGGAALTLQGQGPATVITLTSGGSQPVFSDGGSEPAITVKSLKVTLPAGETAGGIALGAPATVGGVTVSGGASASGYGIAVSGGGVLDTDIVVITPGPDIDPAVFVSGPATTTVRNSVLSDRTGLESTGPGNTIIHRSVLTGSGQDAAVIAESSPISIDDSVLGASGQASGLEAFGSGATILAAQLTIIGDSSATGIHVQTPDGATAPATVDISDSIITNPLQHSMALFTAAGAPKATIKTDYCDYDRSTIIGGGAFTPGAHDIQPTPNNSGGYVNPQFVDASKSNYRLAPNSPLLNLDPTPLGGTPVGSIESSTDIVGQTRVTPSGRDLGAYQHQGPAITSAKATPTKAKVKRAVSFAATATIADPHDTLQYSWSFDDGASATGPTVSHAFRTPGTHTATVTVTDAAGYAVHSTVTVTVIGPPVISKVSRKGKYILFTLNVPASVHLRFTLRRKGHTFSVTLKDAGTAGRNRFKFIGKHPAHGRYTVKITAKASGLKAKPRTIHFTF